MILTAGGDRLFAGRPIFYGCKVRRRQLPQTKSATQKGWLAHTIREPVALRLAGSKLATLPRLGIARGNKKAEQQKAGPAVPTQHPLFSADRGCYQWA